MFDNLLPNIIDFLKKVNDYPTILIILSIGIITLLLDMPKYKKQGYVKEVRIIKGISYSYMALSGLMYVLLLIM